VKHCVHSYNYAILVLSTGSSAVLTLYSHPELLGLPDNNPYGLKVFAFLKLAKLPFRHEHIFESLSQSVLQAI
jgi:hypothetical protein